MQVVVLYSAPSFAPFIFCSIIKCIKLTMHQDLPPRHARTPEALVRLASLFLSVYRKKSQELHDHAWRTWPRNYSLTHRALLSPKRNNTDPLDEFLTQQETSSLFSS